MAKRVTAARPVEAPWALPDGWRWERLGSIGRWGSGGTPKAKSPDYYGGGIPWYKIGDLTDGVLRGSSDTITQAGLDASSAKWVPASALLIAMYGSIGKLGLTIEPVTTNQAIAFCVPDTSSVDLKYLFYFLLFRRGHLLSLGQGGTQQNISQTILLEEKVALPHRDMQARIVARIDELFAEIDDGEAALARARDDLATWRKALLKAAVTGELTADWRAANPAGETGADLLAHILAERRSEPKAKGKQSTEASRSDDDDDDGDHPLPEGWSRCRPNEIVEWSSGKFMPDRSMNGGDVPVYGGNGIAGYHNEALVHEPTLVIGRVGHYCGNAYATEGAAWISDNAIYASKVATGVAVHYLRLVFEQVNLRRMAQGGAQPFVSQTLLNSISIPLPAAQEQAVILKAVEDGLAESQDLELFIDEANAHSSTLRQSLLAAAFRGDLA